MQDPVPLNGPADNRDTLYFLGQIDAKISMLLANEKKVEDRLSKQDIRITSIERHQWRVAGIAASIPSVLTCIGLVIAYFSLTGV